MIERKTFTYDGQNSADFGLYIAGDSVYDAPTRDMDMITIPGRNGQLSIDQGRFENITVTYPAFIWANTQAEFRTKLRAIRNWLTSKHSYYKLSDNYNPESYRLGIYKSGLEVDPVFYNRAGRFELSFDCKPQRFLLSGDEQTVIGIWGDTETKTGEIVSFENEGKTGIKSLVANIEPIQSGTGDPSPSNVRPISGYSEVVTSRVGKNLLKIYYVEGGGSSIVTLNDDQTSITLNGTLSSASTINIVAHPRGLNVSDVPEGVQLVMSNSANIRLLLSKKSGGQSRWISPNSPFTIASTELASYFYYNIPAGTYNNEVITFQIELGSTATAYEPYNGTTYNTSLGQTVYGGTLDVVSGVLTIDRFGYVFNGTETIWSGDQGGHTRFTVVNVFTEGPAYTRGQWCSHFAPNTAPIGANNYNNVITGYTPVKHLFIRADAYATADELKAYILQQYQNGTPVTYVSYLQTPTIINLTPTQVKTLLGQNNIWADAGTVEVEIGENPNILVNPTPFESCPVFEVEGSGTLTVGNVSMNIVNSGTTIIDSEMMEAYEEENGAIISRNDSVSGEFPKLESGNNNIDTVGLTSVKITPRWWEV